MMAGERTKASARTAQISHVGFLQSATLEKAHRRMLLKVPNKCN
jgi:hypothetical protein